MKRFALKIDTQGSEWFALQGAKELLRQSPELAFLLEFWPYALRGASPEQLVAFLQREHPDCLPQVRLDTHGTRRTVDVET